MKNNKIIACIVVLALVLVLGGCDSFMGTTRTTGELTTVNLVIGGSDGSRGGSGVFGDTNVVSLWVAAFDSDGVRIPDTWDDSSAPYGNSSDGVASLTRNSGTKKWEGRMSLDLSGVVGDITLHTVGENAAGEVLYHGNKAPFSNFGAADITLTIESDPYTTGVDGSPDTAAERGPGGGYVFYDKGSYSAGWRYLEAAPAINGQFTNIEWGAYGYTVSPAATGLLVGTGAVNTANIVTYHNGLDPDYYATPGNYNVNNDGTVAAKSCAELNINGYEDWFLPSRDELNLMYQNLHNEETPVGGFDATYYWSSSENGSSSAWLQNFNGGSQSNYAKYTNLRVRAVRAF